MCTYALTLSLFMFLSYGVVWQQVAIRLFFTWVLSIYIILDEFSTEINLCFNDISFFYFKLLFLTNVSQNSVNFNQAES